MMSMRTILKKWNFGRRYGVTGRKVFNVAKSASLKRCEEAVKIFNATHKELFKNIDFAEVEKRVLPRNGGNKE